MTLTDILISCFHLINQLRSGDFPAYSTFEVKTLADQLFVTFHTRSGRFTYEIIESLPDQRCTEIA